MVFANNNDSYQHNVRDTQNQETNTEAWNKKQLIKSYEVGDDSR